MYHMNISIEDFLGHINLDFTKSFLNKHLAAFSVTFAEL